MKIGEMKLEGENNEIEMLRAKFVRFNLKQMRISVPDVYSESNGMTTTRHFIET
jgi:hypothetical protein